MKKLLIMAALVGITLTSCTSDNDGTEKSRARREIKFAPPVMYNISRVIGEIKGPKYPQTESFIVYGINYSDDKAYPGWGEEGSEYEFPAEGVEVVPRYESGSNEPTGWFPKFAHYYKQGFNYAFAAYSPSSYTKGVTYDNKKGLQIRDFEPAEMGKQIDVMYAPRIYDKNLNSEMTHGEDLNGNEFYDGLNLTFKHALTSIHFRVCVDPRYKRAMNAAGYKFVDGDFKIKSITLTNVKNKGDFNENIKNEGDVIDKNIYKAEPFWTLDGSVKDIKFLDSDKYLDITLPADSEKTIRQAAKDITEKFDGHYGLLIPQNLVNSDVRVVIKWQHKVWLDDENFRLDDMTTDLVLENQMESKMWKAGKRYIYNIVFRENLIYFAPTIEDWTEEENDIFPKPDDNGVIVP